jgi:hypothetical protein
VCPVSREIDFRFPVFARACPFTILCLEPVQIFHQLPAIQHEDALD